MNDDESEPEPLYTHFTHRRSHNQRMLEDLVKSSRILTTRIDTTQLEIIDDDKCLSSVIVVMETMAGLLAKQAERMRQLQVKRKALTPYDEAFYEADPLE